MNKWRFVVIIIFFGFLQSCNTDEKLDSGLDSHNDTVEISEDRDAELKEIDSKLEKDPNNAVLLSQRAKVLMKMGLIQEGLPNISTAFRLDSLNLEIRKIHADYMLAGTRILAARKDYSYIIEQNPGNAEAYLGMARTYAIEDYYEKAFQYADEALKRDQYLRDAYELKGLMFRVQNKLDLAISSYQTAVEVDPKFYSGYVALGNLFEIKENPIAFEYYQTAYQLDTTGVDAMYGMAIYLQYHKEEERAQELYRKMLHYDSTNFIAYYNQGWIKLVIQEELDSATHFFNKTLEIAPNYADAWYNLGLTQTKKKNKVKALECFKNVLKIDPNYKDADEQIKLLLKI